MDKIIINGGKPLYGDVEISGMKNAALPIIFGCILTKSKCTIENVPMISDVTIALDIIRSMGAEVEFVDDATVIIDTKNLCQGKAPADMVSKMRASTYLLGAELGRFGRSSIGMPGGCNFGSRPIDQHVKGFETLGATVTVTEKSISATTDRGIRSGNVYFDLTSVGATINIMTAAVLAEGMTVIENAACEPHVVDLANFFNTCGARITGAGTNIIKIRGVEELHGCTYEIIPDMIEAGTFMTAVAAVGGSVNIKNVIPKHLESITAKLRDMGVTVEEDDESLRIISNGDLKPTRVQTSPYPGFPTDMQPQFVALMCMAHGESALTETVFDHRFGYIEELKKMNADIEIEGRAAKVKGCGKLLGASVHGPDLRAGAAMIVAGLAAEGTTTVTGIEYIKRGYHDIVGKFKRLGAVIEEIDNA